MTRPISDNKLYITKEENDNSIFREGITKKIFWSFIFIFWISGFISGIVIGLAHGGR